MYQEMINKSFIVLFFITLITIIIAMMFLEKNKSLLLKKQKLNQDIYAFTEEFITQWEKDYHEIDENKKRSCKDNEMYPSYEKQKEGFQSSSIIEGLDIGRDIERALMKPLQPLMDFFETVKRAFETVPGRLNNLGNSFKGFGRGIELEFVNIGKSLDLGFSDIFNVVGTIGECGIKSLTNLRSCMIWYIMDFIGTTLYSIFVKLPVFIIYTVTGFSIQSYIDQIHCVLETIDSMLFELTCFHIFHYPEWVIDMCYTCKFQEQVDKVNLDWKKTIPDLMNQPNAVFNNAFNDLKSVFT